MQRYLWNQEREAQARDLALDRLAESRADLIAVAQKIAKQLCQTHGQVTSPEVLRVMRQQGYGGMLDKVDRRFMGCVFCRGWRRIGYENSGSHGRPVSVWVLSNGGRP